MGCASCKALRAAPDRTRFGSKASTQPPSRVDAEAPVRRREVESVIESSHPAVTSLAPPTERRSEPPVTLTPPSLDEQRAVGRKDGEAGEQQQGRGSQLLTDSSSHLQDLLKTPRQSTASSVGSSSATVGAKHMSHRPAQVTPDSSIVESSASPRGVGVLGQRGSAEITVQKRDLGACRLKKSQDILEDYDMSQHQVLGTGISGAVRVATHKLSGRQFAIKTLSLESVGAKKAAMLHNEVSIYLKLDHPNIARLIEVYETDKNFHLVMELCTGGELYDRLATKKRYREADAANVTRQMLSAINYCHQHRICHRDLKLENWVYAEKSEDAPLKLIDFGFSRIFNPGIPMTAMHGTVYYVSPEVMDGCYQEKCDIWSLGVIVYMLLSGSPPFNGSYDHEILLKIRGGHFNFAGSRWQGISDKAKQFIVYLLQRDPDHRPSAADALRHPWLQQEESETNDIDLEVVKSMRDFALGNVLKRAAMAVVALSMSSKEVEELEKAFRALDKDNRGTIQLQDLAKLLKEKLNIDKEEAQRIFERIDQTGSREVRYSDFIASTVQAKIIKNDKLIREAFQRFDLNKKEAITLDNLRAVIGDTYNGCRVEEIMELCDSNGDGMIDFDEFCKALFSDEAALAQANSSTEEKSSSTSESPASGLSTVSGQPLLDEERVLSSRPIRSSQSRLKQKRESAITALQSMRKATWLNALSEEEVDPKNTRRSWDPFAPTRQNLATRPTS